MNPQQADASRQAAVVYNPIKIDVEAVRAAVAEAEREAGWKTTLWFETSEEDGGQGQARDALAQGADMIIAAGGDGTVRAVAEGMHESDASLALLPSGTGNLLARNLKLTLEDLDNSLHTAFGGTDRAVDLGLIDIRREDDTVTSHVYVVMAGLGIDAQMLANTDPALKKRVGWLAYAKALVKTLREKNHLDFRYSYDEKPARSMRANTIIVGNCGALPANILLLPDAAIDDVSVGDAFVGREGVRQYLERFFVGYSTSSMLLSIRELDDFHSDVRLDFTGDFGHEIGILKVAINPDGLIQRIDADLE